MHLHTIPPGIINYVTRHSFSFTKATSALLVAFLLGNLMAPIFAYAEEISASESNTQPTLEDNQITVPNESFEVVGQEIESENSGDSSESIDAEQNETQIQDTESLVPNEQIQSESSLTSSGAMAGSDEAKGKFVFDNASVSNYDGAFVYQYVIDVPPGRNGLEPTVVLEYDSNKGSDHNIFGYGWSIDIPYIQRINKYGSESLYSSSTETFYSSLSGELVRIGSTTEYRSKLETGKFVKYQFDSDVWTAFTKDGTIYTFGSTSAARQDNPSNSSQIYKWMVDDIRDTNNNYVKYEYYKNSGQIYPEAITYTGNGTTDGIFEIIFTRESKTTSYKNYEPMFAVTTAYRINEIQVEVDSSLVRKYELDYLNGDNNNRDLLDKIVKNAFNEDGSATTTLPSELYTYQSNNTDLRQEVSSYGYTIPGLFYDEDESPTDMGYRLAEVNGDGLMDIVFADGVEPENAIIYINDGNGFTSSTTWSFDGITNAQDEFSFRFDGVRMLDINGDNLTDVVHSMDTDSGAYKHAYLNNGVDGWVYDGAYSASIPDYFIDTDHTDYTDLGYVFADVNGDGLPDILWDESLSTLTDTKVFINTGTKWEESTVWNLPVFEDLAFTRMLTRAEDVNGDNLADIVHGAKLGNESLSITFINTGNGSWVADYTWAPPIMTDNYEDLGYRLVDVNNDNLVDIVQANPNTGVETVNLNTGNGWGSNTPWTFPLDDEFSLSDKRGFIVDMDGDGIVDLFRSEHYNNYVNKRVYLNKGPKADTISKISNAMGGEITVGYKGSSELGDTSGYRKNPSLPLTVQVVASTSYNSKFGSIWQHEYMYEEGDYYYSKNDLRDRKFAGFGKIITETPFSTEISYYHQGNDDTQISNESDDGESKIGFKYRHDVFDTNSNLYKTSYFTFGTSSIGQDITFVAQNSILEMDFDGDTDHRDKAQSFVYDNEHGSLTTFIEWGEVTGSTTGLFGDTGTDKRTTVFVYATNTDNVVKIKQETVLDNASSTVRDKKYYYDNQSLGVVTNGNLTKREEWATSTTYIDYEWGYNSQGLITSEKDPRDKVTAYTHDTYNLHIATSTNPEGHVVAYTYDYSSGQIERTTDPAGRIFETFYDPLDRMEYEYIPDPVTGSPVEKSFTDYTDTKNAVSFVRQDAITGSVEMTTYHYLDGFGREIQKRKEAEGFNNYIVTDTVYGTNGLVNKESLPYIGTYSDRTAVNNDEDLFTEYAYDALKRVVAATNTVGTINTTYDQWEEVVSDPLENNKDFDYDAFGRLNKVTEHNGTSTYETHYVWDHNNNLLKITDALGNVRNITYDGLSRRTSLEDIHDTGDATFGVWEFTYDNSGNLTSETDPKDQTINYTYDDINRVLTEDFIGQTGTELTYVYDTCTRGESQLCSVASSDATTTYSYDYSGDISSESKSIAGITYTIEYEYDRQHNPVLIIYPDDSEVRYTYNVLNKIEKIEQREDEESFTDIITDFDYGPHELVTYQLHGNGVYTTRTYEEDQLYRLANISTEASSTESFLGFFSVTPFTLLQPLAMLDASFEPLIMETVAFPEVIASTTDEELFDGQVLSRENGTTTDSVTEIVGIIEVVSTTTKESATSSEDINIIATSSVEVLPEDISTSTIESATSTSVSSSTESIDSVPGFRTQLKGKTAFEKANIKSEIITSQVNTLPRQGIKGSDIELEITSTNLIDGGIEVFVRAWKNNGIQVGFGADGSVDIERFRIFNPPILVPDENGIIERKIEDELTELSLTLTYREDPKEALIQTVAHAISVKKEKFGSDKIVKGRVGNTTSIFYTDSDPESATVDGMVVADNGAPLGGTYFSTLHDDAGDSADDSNTWFGVGYVRGSTGASYYRTIRKSIATFDTSPLGSETLNNVTLSLYAIAATNPIGFSPDMAVGVYDANPASSTALAASDFQNIGTTALSDTTYVTGAITTSAYNDFEFNSTGKAYINGSGVTELGLRDATYDVPDIVPTNAPNWASTHVDFVTADTTGSTQDPKLIVEHGNSSPGPLGPTGGIQNVSYTYDKVGNITKIVDGSTSLTYGTTTYQYDDLYRLTLASTSQATTTPFLRTYTYSAIGNILNKSDQGSYAYGEIGYANPHAVTSIAGTSYTYDQNGNLISSGSDNYVWDYRNRLIESGGSFATTSYVYDHNNQRVMKIGGVTGSGGGAYSTDTGFHDPTANGDDVNEWNVPQNAYSSNNAVAEPGRDAGTDEHDYYDFSFSVPSGATIDGIEASIEGEAPSSGRDMVLACKLSWNGGTDYTSTKTMTWIGATSESVKTYGGPTDTWGRSWVDTELSNANFRFRCQQTNGAGTNNDVDHIQVKVYYTSSGSGGSGSDTGWNTTGTVEINTGWSNFTTTRINSSDNSRATCSSTCDNSDNAETSDYNFDIPTGATINGIEVAVEAREQYSSGNIGLDVSLSWDDGANFTSSKSVSVDGTTDSTYVLGGASDTWGRSWSQSELADGTFRAKFDKVTSSDTLHIDQVQIKVYYTTSGGGGGGTGTSTIYVSSIYEQTGTSTTKHIYAGDMLVATIEDGEVFHNHLDHLNSISVVTNSSGEVEQSLGYYPFGSSRIDQQYGTLNQTKRYTGHEYDEETDLSYMGARYYDGNTGRFSSLDPVALALGDKDKIKELTNDDIGIYLKNPQVHNSYAYAVNNPLKYIDKNGEYVELAVSGHVGILGATIGLRTGTDGINVNLSASGGLGVMANVEGSYVPGVPVSEKVEASIGRHGSFAAGAGLQYSKEGEFDLSQPISLPGNAKSNWSVLAGLGGEVSQDYSISIPVVRFNHPANQQSNSNSYVSLSRTITNLSQVVSKLSDTINRLKEKKDKK